MFASLIWQLDSQQGIALYLILSKAYSYYPYYSVQIKAPLHFLRAINKKRIEINLILNKALYLRALYLKQ